MVALAILLGNLTQEEFDINVKEINKILTQLTKFHNGLEMMQIVHRCYPIETNEIRDH